MQFQSHIGLDIGSTTIRLAQLSPLEPGRFKLLTLGEIETPKIENKAEWNVARVESIKKLISQAHTSSRQAVIGLSESQVYTRVVEMPYLEEPDLSQAISWQAEQYIPVPLTEVVLKHQVLSLPGQSVPGAKMSVLLLAAPNDVLASCMSVASSAGLEVVAVETEILATIRALSLSANDFPQTLIIHIGAETTTFCIYREGVLSLTQSIGTGGAAITRAIATELGLDAAQAEKYKRSYGMDETKLDGKVVGAIKPVLDFVLSESKRVLAAFDSHGESLAVKRIVLSGGGSILPGIVQYLVNTLNLEVQLADPFYGVVLSDSQKLEIGETGPAFSVAVGLALKPT